VNRRILETGPRNQFDDRNAFRTLIGVKGPAFGDWTYEAYYSYARTRNAQIQNGNISRSAFQAGLDGTGPNPINVFGPGTISDAAITDITILSQNSDISILQVASASLSGTLGNLGLGADDIGLAIGTEYRKVSSSFTPDTALSSGDVIGFNAGLPTSGGYDVREVFAELRVPIISDGFVYRLELNGAFRYSDYSLAGVGGVETYSIGGEFAPIRDITFRGQYQRAVRAPNVGELFGGQANGFPAATDPCALATAATDPTIRALCIATGVPASAVGTGVNLQPNAQIQGLFGGNPNLGEETADTYTAGVVIRPSFIPRLNISVDYFDITIEDTVSVLGGGLGNTLNLCYNQIQDINSVYCQAVVRDPSTGIIGDDFIPSILNANIGGLTSKGIDFQVDYSLPLGFSLTGAGESKLNFFFLGTYQDEAKVIPVQDLPDLFTECAGRFGVSACGEPQPDFKWTSRLSLIDGPMTASFRWRHLDSVRDDDDSTDYVVEKIGSYDLFDLSFGYEVSDQMTFTVGVNNLLDDYPDPVGSNQSQSNTYPGTYDVIGRDFFVSANFRF
jgi:outer membrane receptor protein involved in Fe transport